jgi:hypothetical protein
MADFVALKDLVHAIAGAVAEAQQEIEKAQIANLSSYLDRERRPLTVQMRVPSIRPEAGPGEEDIYQVPLIALTSHNNLRIKQVEVSFDIQLGDLTAPATATKQARATSASERPEIIAAQVKRDLNVNPAVSATVKQQGTSAHVVLTIEGVQTPEGVSRIVMDMTKTQGIIGPATKHAAT